MNSLSLFFADGLFEEECRHGDADFDSACTKEPIDIEYCRALAETDRGLYVSVMGRRGVWVPKSQIAQTSQVRKKGDVGTLTATKWIAQMKGLTV